MDKMDELEFRVRRLERAEQTKRDMEMVDHIVKHKIQRIHSYYDPIWASDRKLEYTKLLVKEAVCDMYDYMRGRPKGAN